MKRLIYILALAAALCVHVSAQSSGVDSQEDLQRYVPVLPSVKAQFWKIDPKQGARLFPYPQRSHRWLRSIQERQRPQDRCARYGQRLLKGNKRSGSIVAQRNFQNGENANAWRQDCRAQPPRLSF